MFILAAAFTVPASPTRTLAAGGSGVAVAGGGSGVQAVAVAPVDFDGDQKMDWAVVRNTGGGPAGQLTWYSLTQTGVVTATPWGLAGDVVVPGDYDGDGKVDLAVWRPGSPGTFYVRRSTDGGLLVQTFGETGDDPTVVGDYDGDGRTDFAVYRQGSTPGAQSRWFWMRSFDGQFGARAWGLHGDVPAPGDYDGDRVADFGIRRDTVSPPSVFYLQQSTAGFRTIAFGFPSDTVVPGDYDGDGRTDVAVTRVVGGQLQWFAFRSSDSTTQGLSWGVTGDLAVPGDYDGDGRTDAAIWRASADPTANRFWVLATGGGTLAQQWGLQHDYPVANFNARQNLTLPANQAPVITSAAGAAFATGAAGSFTVTTSGFPIPTIARGGAALPSGVTFVDNRNGTGTLGGTPGASTVGTYAISFTATNSEGTTPAQSFTLTVSELPVAGNDSPGTIDANTGLSGLGSGPTNLLFNDALGLPPATLTSFGGGSLGGTAASFTAGAAVAPLPGFGSGSLVVNANGSYTLAAPTGFTGVFTFRYRLTSVAGSSDGTVTINVRPVTRADVFAPTVIGNVAIDIALSVLTANDVANPPFTAAVVSGTTTAGGQVSAVAGVIRYDPPAGYEGADSFSYTIIDAGGFASAPAPVSLTVGGMIWFVNNSAATNGSGRQSAPFNSLQNFVAVNDGVGAHPADNESIFLYQTPTPYVVTPAPLVLRTGQRLIGQDHLLLSLAELAGVTVPAGSTLPAMRDGPPTVVASTIELRDFVQIHGLTVRTGASRGITDPASVVRGMSTSEVTVESTTGAAIDLSDVAANLSFRSVSADGALHGIRLVNTTGTFNVKGRSNGLCGGDVNTGTDPYIVTAPDVADCTGGTIRNTTSNGIRLINADTVDLRRMRILSTTGSGIKGSGNVVNFFFTYGYIDGSHDDGVDQHIANIAFNEDVTGTETNLTDQVTIQHSTFKNGLHHALDIVNYAGTIEAMSVIFNVYTSGTVGGPAGTSRGSGVRLLARGTATTATTTTRVVLTNSVYTNFPSGSAIEVIAGNPHPTGPPTLFGTPGAAQTGSAVVIGNNRMRGESVANPMRQAVVARVEGRAQANIHISGHGTAIQPVTNVSGEVIVHTVRGDATVTSFLQDNHIVANHAVDAGDPVGIRVAAGEFALGAATLTAVITGNAVSQTDGSGIVAWAAEGGATLNARISGNTVATPLGAGTANGIVVGSGGVSSTNTAVCLDILANTSSGQNGAAGIGLHKQGTVSTTNRFAIEGMAMTASPAVEAFVAGLNPAGGGTALISGASGFSDCGTAPGSGLRPAARSEAPPSGQMTTVIARRGAGRPVF